MDWLDLGGAVCSLFPQMTVHGFKGVALEQFYLGFGTKAWAKDLSPLVMREQAREGWWYLVGQVGAFSSKKVNE